MVSIENIGACRFSIKKKSKLASDIYEEIGYEKHQILFKVLN
jgi:hypothetical protein